MYYLANGVTVPSIHLSVSVLIFLAGFILGIFLGRKF